MSIIGVNFDNQHVQAKHDGAVQAAGLSDGILYGCEITASGTNIYIAAGAMMIKGRMFELDAQQVIGVSGTSGYARVICEANMNGTATEETFAQVSFSVDYSASIGGFTDLTQEDINDSGVTYQMEVAVVALDGSGVSNIERTIGAVAPGALSPDRLETMTVTFESGSPATADFLLIKA